MYRFNAPASFADSDYKIVRREQCARSHEHRGLLSRVICEFDVLEVLHTEVEPGSSCDSQEFGGCSAVHVVIDGTPAFRTSHRSAELMPGDSIVFANDGPYTISNGAPTRSVILSVLFKRRATEVQPTLIAAKEVLA